MSTSSIVNFPPSPNPSITNPTIMVQQNDANNDPIEG